MRNINTRRALSGEEEEAREVSRDSQGNWEL